MSLSGLGTESCPSENGQDPAEMRMAASRMSQERKPFTADRRAYALWLLATKHAMFNTVSLPPQEGTEPTYFAATISFSKNASRARVSDRSLALGAALTIAITTLEAGSIVIICPKIPCAPYRPPG